jgi:16S rRNA (cytosine967-C5)-methyltransferase
MPQSPKAARRLRVVNAHPPLQTLALATLLNHTANAVQAVLAGQSLNAALLACPALARPGTQALSFHALRWLGCAGVTRALLTTKVPPPSVDALLLTSLALIWPHAQAPYAEHTLVDQAVSCARQRAPASAAFINAVLRRFLRERDALVAAALQDPVARYNHPVWWVDRLRRDWPEHWQTLLEANNLRAPMYLRVNARRGDASSYIARLMDQGMLAHVVDTHMVVMEQPCPVGRLPGFEVGDVSVQDAHAQLAAPLLLKADLPAQARVLDACAAPGGKTAHLLELADLDVLALDSDPQRLIRVDETMARLGLSARTLAADAGEPARWWNGQAFDAILLDAPCSAAGIVRRHPDVRWLRRSTDIATLMATQARLLTALWPLLRPGGRLLYASCSVFKAEGQNQIEKFLRDQSDASLIQEPGLTGHLLPLPGKTHAAKTAGFGPTGDGFFYALIEKS